MKMSENFQNNNFKYSKTGILFFVVIEYHGENSKMKSIIWVGKARHAMKDLPVEVQDEFGFGLYLAQLGRHPFHAKSLRGFSGVFEIVSDFDKRTFRCVYATKMVDKIFVLHVFQKKSHIGIKTPKLDIELIRERLKLAQEIAENLV
jgi:phage-related protein